MKSLLKKVFSRKIVLSFIAFSTLCDVVFTVFILKNYFDPNLAASGEFNPLIRYFIQTFGLEYALLVIVPLIMGALIFIIYRFWNFAPLRYYAYFLFIIRVGLFFYNSYIMFVIFKN